MSGQVYLLICLKEIDVPHLTPTELTLFFWFWWGLSSSGIRHKSDLAGRFELFFTYLLLYRYKSFKMSSMLIKLVWKGTLKVKTIRHVYEFYTPLSDKRSHQAHFRKTTRAQALNQFLELWIWGLWLFKMEILISVKHRKCLQACHHFIGNW